MVIPKGHNELTLLLLTVTHLLLLTYCYITVYTNVRSLTKKGDDLRVFLGTAEPDIAVLSETWLPAKIRNYELISCTEISACYRADGRQVMGDEVLNAVSNDLPSSIIDISTFLETVWLSV